MRFPSGLSLLVLLTLTAVTPPVQAAEVLRLDFENGADLAADSSGNGLIATIFDNSGGFAVFAQSNNARPGSPGSSSALFEVDQFTTNPYAAGLYLDFETGFPVFTGEEDFTLAYWMNPSSNWLDDLNGFRAVVAGPQLSGGGWQIDNGDNVLEGEGVGADTPVAFNRDNAFTPLATSGGLVAGQWYEVKLSYYSAVDRTLVYLDDELSGVAVGSLGMDGLHVGASRNATRYFDGLLDDILLEDTSSIDDGSGGQYMLGDLTLDGAINTDDWLALRSGQAADLSGMSLLEAYQMGDVDFDGDNDFQDFLFFKDLYNASPAAAATPFTSLPAPEPTALALILAVLVAGCFVCRPARPRRSSSGRPSQRRRLATVRRITPLPIAALAAVLCQPSAATAQQIINIDMTIHPTAGPTGYSLPGVIGNQTSAFWNPYSNGDLVENLRDEDGFDSSVGFQITGTYGSNMASDPTGVAAAGVFSYFGGGDTESDFYFSYAYAHGGGDPGAEDTIPFEISGLGAGTHVNEVLFYSTWEYANSGAEFRVSTDGGATFSDWKISYGVPSESNAPFNEGYSYVRFSNLSAPANGKILGEWRTTTTAAPDYPNENYRNRGPFNAIQISADLAPLGLILEVASNGQLKLVNPFASALEIDYLTITSADEEEDGGSLNPAGFAGLGANPGFPAGNDDGTGWELADNNSALTIIESYLAEGGSEIGPNAEIVLGSGFVPGSTPDLTLAYHIVGRSNLNPGIVNYIAPEGLPGDFNGDNVVDAADYAVWRNNLGTSFDLSGNGDESNESSGTVDQADYDLWRSNYGNSGSPSAAQSTPSPEPSAAGLAICLSLLGGRGVAERFRQASV